MKARTVNRFEISRLLAACVQAIATQPQQVDGPLRPALLPHISPAPGSWTHSLGPDGGRILIVLMRIRR